MLRSGALCWARGRCVFHCRGANPPSCDSGTGQSSRWRLRYDVYQYFLPENDLSEMVLMSHIRKMSGVQSIRANGIKVSPKHWVPAVWCSLVSSCPVLVFLGGRHKQAPWPCWGWNGSLACLGALIWVSRLLGSLSYTLRQGGAKQEWENLLPWQKTQ